MISAPPITVLLAVYNGQRYLREAIDSVLSQTCTDFEFLIIDDGSTDQTPAMLSEYAAGDPRIRIMTRSNAGLTKSLNYGLSLARGEFIARMDSDDICLPQRFEKQLAFLRENPSCVLVGSSVFLIDPEGLPINQMCEQQTHEEIDTAHLKRGWPVVHPAIMMRLAAVQQVGGYRDEFNMLEDLDLFLRLAEIGRLANLPDVLLKYRQHFGSVTHSKEAKQMELRLAIYEQTRQRRGLTDATLTDPVPWRTRRVYEQHEFWGWSALKAGNVKTARKHAVKMFTQAPYMPSSWRLLACALRGW